MALFDSLATNGALRPKEFATILQMFATTSLKQPIEPMLQAGTAAIQGSIGSAEDTPAMQNVRTKMKPIVSRAIDRLDTAHMKTFLEMLFRVMDANNNGTIEKSEFESFFNSVLGPGGGPAAAAELLYKMIDKNGNGKLTVDEVQALIDAIAEIVCTVISGIADMGEVAIGSSDTTSVAVDLIKELGKQAGVEDDMTNILPRDELTKKMEESGAFVQLEQMIQGVDENKAQIMGVVKAMRESIGKLESNVGAKFYMKAMEFSKGGVNEATFVAQVVPIIRDHQKEKWAEFEADPLKGFGDQTKIFAAICPPPSEEIMNDQINALGSDKELIAAMKKANERASEYIPEMVRSVFRFLDLDGSGTITSKEIKLLKALLDALLHLGERAVTELSEEQMKSIEGTTKENANTLALTIYDIVDRDGNGKLSLVEFVQFIQKVVVFLLAYTKFAAHTVIECQIDEVAKCKLEQDWKAKNKTEVEKDEFMQMVMMAPMMFAMMMPR